MMRSIALLCRADRWLARKRAVPRAIRKALEQSGGRPCDRLIVLRSVRPEAGARSPGQVAMDKGLWRVLRDAWTELVARGVEIVDRGGEPMGAP